MCRVLESSFLAHRQVSTSAENSMGGEGARERLRCSRAHVLTCLNSHPCANSWKWPGRQHSISTTLPLMPEAQSLQGDQDSPWTWSIDGSISREGRTGRNALRGLLSGSNNGALLPFSVHP